MFTLRLTALCLCLGTMPPVYAQTLPTLPALPAPKSLTTQALHPVIAILPKGQVNKPYPAISLIAGGTAPYTNQIQGALPPGMSIGSTGTLFGTPRQAGLYKFKIDFADSAGGTLTLTYTLQIPR